MITIGKDEREYQQDSLGRSGLTGRYLGSLCDGEDEEEEEWEGEVFI